MTNEKMIKRGIAESEFEFNGVRYIAMNELIAYELKPSKDFDKCDFCAFGREKGKCDTNKIPQCSRYLRVDEREVYFIEKGARFKPKFGSKYWTATLAGKAIDFIWTDCNDDRKNLLAFNTFPSREAAQKVCDKIKALLESAAGK